MKRLLYMITGLLLFAIPYAKAQQAIANPDKMWTVPSVYTMDEPVTWFFDFAGASQLADGEKLYLWIWAPTNPTGAPVPLTYAGERVWSISFTPTEFFNMTSEQLYANTEPFYFLLRDLDGTKLTGTLSLPKVDYIKNFVESGKVMDYGPTDFQVSSTLTILFNSNLVSDFNPAPATVHLHSGLNDWEVKQEFQAWLPEIREKTKFKHLGNGIYKKDIVPKTYFGVDEDYDLKNIVFLAVKYNGNEANPDWAGTSPDFVITAAGTPVPLPPNLFFFPIKISLSDILVITRDNNLRGQHLTYTITGGSKILNGEMEGSMARQRAFINVAGAFKGMDISKLHILIKDQNGTNIYNEDLPLLKVDNPK